MNRGFFGIGLFHPKHECNQGTLWRSAFAFGASFAFTIGPRFTKQASDTGKSWRHLPMYQYDTIESLKDRLPYDCRIVAIELGTQSRSLREYTHSERACYLLGAEDHGLPAKILNHCHDIVQITDLRMCLNVATAGSLVMYDRQYKNKTAVFPFRSRDVVDMGSLPR